MKSKKCVWTIIAAMAIVMGACDKDDSSKDDAQGYFWFKSFICSYAELPTQEQVEAAVLEKPVAHVDDPANLRWLQKANVQSVKTYQDVRFVLRDKLGTNQTLYHELWGTGPFSKEEKTAAAKFTELSIANDDQSYNREGQSFGYCLYKKTESLHVISDAAYDAQHPAGTLLDDILDVDFWSAEDFLKSGYNSFFDYLGETTRPIYPESSDGAEVPAVGPFMIESLAEFNRIQRTLINFGFIFMPTKAPDWTSKHRFTITYTNEDGTVLTGTTDPVTIQGADE